MERDKELCWAVQRLLLFSFNYVCTAMRYDWLWWWFYVSFTFLTWYLFPLPKFYFHSYSSSNPPTISSPPQPFWHCCAKLAGKMFRFCLRQVHHHRRYPSVLGAHPQKPAGRKGQKAGKLPNAAPNPCLGGVFVFYVKFLNLIQAEFDYEPSSPRGRAAFDSCLAVILAARLASLSQFSFLLPDWWQSSVQSSLKFNTCVICSLATISYYIFNWQPTLPVSLYWSCSLFSFPSIPYRTRKPIQNQLWESTRLVRCT